MDFEIGVGLGEGLDFGMEPVVNLGSILRQKWERLPSEEVEDWFRYSFFEERGAEMKRGLGPGLEQG